MERTKEYFDIVTAYRAALTAIWENYDSAIDRLERYKGSRGYEEQAAAAGDERDAAIKAEQEETYRRFQAVLIGMKESALRQTITAPSQEQLNLLTVLKMREKVSKDELRQAAAALGDNPACVAVLSEIAKKSDYLGFSFGKESTSSILEHIDSLTESAKRLCKLDKPNSRREQVARQSIYSLDYSPNATYSFRVDRDYNSAADCMAYMGGVNDVEAFTKAVNG